MAGVVGDLSQMIVFAGEGRNEEFRRVDVSDLGKVLRRAHPRGR